jgi:hypothetical protein
MATRANILKLMQEIHGFARVTHRRPQPRPPALFLMEIRSQTHYSELPKRKLNIVFQMEELADFPHPVKITHLDRCALPVVVSHSD